LIGTFVNTLAIVCGGLIGLLFRGGIPKTYHTTIMQAISLAVILIGLTGALKSDAFLVIIFSLAIGSVIGELVDIEARLEALGRWFEGRLSHTGNGGIAKGFVTASLVFCVGSMAIVGSLAIGINLLEIKRIKVGNMLPAIFVPLSYHVLRQMVL